MSLRLVNFVPRILPEGAPRPGALTDAGVIDIAEACEAAGVACGCAGSVVDVLSCEEDCLARLREVVAQAQPALPPAEAKLLAPVACPGKLFCLAGNYEEHIREGGREQVHASDRATPRVFMKPSTNTVVGPDDPILISRTAQFVDWEGELAVIIGKKGKYIATEEALQYVGGVTCMNDVSERRLKVWERPDTRPWDKFFDWLNGKWYDSFAPMGPCAVPLADIPDLQDLRLTTRVNGATMQESTTAAMIFPVAEIIEYISQMVTLEPGDVIATGTPAGVGHARDIRLQAGDVVEVEIERIGLLRNPVAEEA